MHLSVEAREAGVEISKTDVEDRARQSEFTASEVGPKFKYKFNNIPVSTLDRIIKQPILEKIANTVIHPYEADSPLEIAQIVLQWWRRKVQTIVGTVGPIGYNGAKWRCLTMVNCPPIGVTVSSKGYPKMECHYRHCPWCYGRSALRIAGSAGIGLTGFIPDLLPNKDVFLLSKQVRIEDAELADDATITGVAKELGDTCRNIFKANNDPIIAAASRVSIDPVGPDIVVLAKMLGVTASTLPIVGVPDHWQVSRKKEDNGLYYKGLRLLLEYPTGFVSADPHASARAIALSSGMRLSESYGLFRRGATHTRFCRKGEVD